MRRFTRKQSLACAVHQAVRGVMVDQLILHGNAHKQVCLDEAGYTYLDDFVRWDYLREQVEEEIGEEIIPVAARFWKMTEQARREKPKKALASGYGKKTAGFALVSWSPEIAQQYLAHKERVRRGITNGANETVRCLQKHNIPLMEGNGKLRDLSDVESLVTNQGHLSLPRPQ